MQTNWEENEDVYFFRTKWNKLHGIFHMSKEKDIVDFSLYFVLRNRSAVNYVELDQSVSCKMSYKIEDGFIVAVCCLAESVCI